MTYGIVGYFGHQALRQLFARLKVGGGGFMTGMDLNVDGTKLCKSDVYGCWLWNSVTSQWDSLLTGARGFTIPSPVGAPGLVAAYDMASAPSNSNVIYIYLNDGNLYRSLDKGVSFVKLTGFTNAPCGTNNGATRFNGRRIAIDPINPDVVLIGTPANGVFVTSNGAQGSASTPTFSVVSGIAVAGNPAGYNVAFDPNGGTTTGKTNVSFIFSDGTGMYKATAPLGAYTLTTATPTSCSRLVVSGNSIVYITDESSTVKKFAAGTWSTLTATGLSTNHSIAVDPANNLRLVAGDQAGNVSVSTNGGTGWTVLPAAGANISPTVPWLALTQDTFKSNGDMAFDPSQSNTLFFAEGIGIYVQTLPNSGANAWTVQTAGIENLQPNAICASPTANGTPLLACWDRFTFYISDPTQYPATQGPNNLISIQMCWDLDWATSDQTTILGTGYFGIPIIDSSAISSDGGQTWKFLPPTTDGARTLTTSGGSLAGTNTLTIATQPFSLGVQMQVSNATHPSSIPAGTYITGNDGTTVTLSQNIASPGVSTGDTINIQFASTPNLRYLQTNAATVSGAVLHFASVPSYIKVGMSVANFSNGPSLPGGGSLLGVKSISGGDVTLNQNVVSTIASGDVIAFNWGPGGCVAMSSPTNFLMCATNDTGFPYVTADGGATWTAIDIAGVPRPILGTLTNLSTTVTGSDTTNLVVGGRLKSGFSLIPNGTTVASITNSTTFEMSAAATLSFTGEIITPESGWGHADYLNHKIMAADRVTANKFYMYNYTTGSIYVSTLSGASGTWSVANSVANSSNLTDLRGGVAQMTGGQNMALKSVPGNANHLFLSNANVASAQNTAFMRSTDGGVNWSAVSNVSGVNAFGFGKAISGGYPAIYIVGQVGGVKGVFRSDDNCVSWVTIVARNSYNILDEVDLPMVIEGDKITFGKFYMATGGNGYAYSFLG